MQYNVKQSSAKMNVSGRSSRAEPISKTTTELPSMLVQREVVSSDIYKTQEMYNRLNEIKMLVV